MASTTRRAFLSGCATVILSWKVTAAPAVEAATVLVIPSMHKRMATSRRYGYADLYAAVAKFSPDIVGIEMRQEDLAFGREYLAANYPVEMIELAARYAPNVFGFDWLGEDLEGRPIPADWWKIQSPIKRLERESGELQSAEMAGRARIAARLSKLSAMQDAILQRATLPSLANGAYDRVTARYYAALAQLYAGTRFEALVSFYRERDARIANNIAEFVTHHPGKRIVVVTGADHHGPVTSALKSAGAEFRLAFPS